jgi:ABC-type Zn uptake system ZnuABC Zn-binding protein ZnuA
VDIPNAALRLYERQIIFVPTESDYRHAADMAEQALSNAIVDILDYDPNYLIWLHNNSEYFELDYKLLEIAEEGFTTEPM